MIVTLNKCSGHRGSLVAIEGNRDISFPIRRVYYIFDVGASEVRGFHAHRELQQLMICTSGSCTVVLDSGIQKTEYRLDDPTRGLLVDKMIWREMRNFSSDAVILVLASENYDPGDYIHDYEEFLSAKGIGPHNKRV